MGLGRGGEDPGGVVKRAWIGSKETWVLFCTPFLLSHLTLEKAP